MALHNYVVSKYVSGTNKSDIELDINQLLDNGRYEIDDPKQLIAEYMFAAIENFIHPQYTLSDIRELLDIDGKHKLLICDYGDTDVVEMIIVKVDNKKQSYYYDIRGGFISRQIYSVKQIDDTNVGYLVSEHIINPYKDCDLIERCYHEYFRDLISAKRYCEGKMKYYSVEKGKPSSGYRISVVDVAEIDSSDWYKDNIAASRDIKDYNLNPEDYRYIEKISDLQKAIKADAYDDLSIEEQALVNFDIYKSLRDFISDDYLIFLDEGVDEASEDELEEIADTAIALALINASSEVEFKKIHDILGPNEYRVGALTDDIFNNHPNEGYIVLSRDGDMGWYPSCYAINEWEKAKGNSYFGKFQKNENDTLLCLREYHPELIADRLPMKKDVDKYETMYQETLSEERKKHSELYFEKAESGRLLACGDWYYEGVLSPKCMKDIAFFKNYGSHSFTDDECRALLSGEELVIENFRTQMGMEITIRGKLKDHASIYDGEPNVDFTRTDINGSRRKYLNAEMGINEPGLPESDEDGI